MKTPVNIASICLWRRASGFALFFALCFGLGGCSQTASPGSGAAASASSTPDASASAAPPSWREQYAYSQGMQAYVFGFPWLYLAQTRWLWVTQPNNPSSVYAPFNAFFNKRNLATAADKAGGSPNNDTLYSLAWLDLTKGPVVVSVPAIDRYYTLEMASMDSDNFAYVGSRTTGSKAGNYAVLPPNWKGTLPAGVTALPPSRTPYAVIFGRTLVNGPADLEAAHAIQDKYKLTPLADWGKAVRASAPNHTIWAPYDPKTDPLADWKTMNRSMSENPPAADTRPLLRSFAEIGIGPGQDVDKVDADTKRGLERAAHDGRQLLVDAIAVGANSKRVHGWAYPPPTIGRAGLSYDYLTRGAIQSLAGIIANDAAEGTYLNTFTDVDGKKLEGSHSYVLHFAPGGLPDVKGFWSLTMYGLDYNLVANDINRYSIGNRTQGVKKDADGGLTIYIQHAKPADDKVSNWLPAPEGAFYLIMRTYWPGTSIVDQTWSPPVLQAQ